VKRERKKKDLYQTEHIQLYTYLVTNIKKPSIFFQKKPQIEITNSYTNMQNELKGLVIKLILVQ